VTTLFLRLVVVLAIVALLPAGASAAPAELFTFRDPQIAESSGIVASATRDDVFFTHNDSGDTARFFAVDRHGCTLGVFTAPGVTATDWEDIARGPGSSLWLGDIGDNNAKRDEIAVYRFDEPPVGTSTDGSGCPPAAEQALAATSYRLRFEDGPRDAETLLVDPRTSQVFIITKSPAAGALYAAPNPLNANDVNVLRKVADVGTPGFATGGDISPDGKSVAVRNYGEIGIRTIPDGDLAMAFAPGARVQRLDAPDRGKQGEGLGFTRVGRELLTSSEGLSAPVFLIPLACPRRDSVSVGLGTRGVRRVRATVDGRAAKVRVRGTRATVSLRAAKRVSGKAVVRVTGRTRHGRRISVVRRVGICES
jgi:hypothetical protein